jgi:hypothetical protein
MIHTLLWTRLCLIKRLLNGMITWNSNIQLMMSILRWHTIYMIPYLHSMSTIITPRESIIMSQIKRRRHTFLMRLYRTSWAQWRLASVSWERPWETTSTKRVWMIQPHKIRTRKGKTQSTSRKLSSKVSPLLLTWPRLVLIFWLTRA